MEKEEEAGFWDEGNEETETADAPHVVNNPFTRSLGGSKMSRCCSMKRPIRPAWRTIPFHPSLPSIQYARATIVNSGDQMMAPPGLARMGVTAAHPGVYTILAPIGIEHGLTA